MMRGADQESRLSPFCQLVGLGILATIGFQALINILVVTGLAPTKGIALPLISRGGTGWMLTCLSLGLIMSMDRKMAREDARSKVEDGAGESGVVRIDTNAISSVDPGAIAQS
jgi:cell division protein FtsW (lipid II flippase)